MANRAYPQFRALSLFLPLIAAIVLFANINRRTVHASPTISVSTAVPNELNPPYNLSSGTGGAPNATPDQAAAFAWQEFIALNWPAAPQQGQPNQRDTPSPTCKFGDPTCTGPTVWQTFRGKVEIFPGTGTPPGYPNVSPSDTSYGYDATPIYKYQAGVPACDAAQQNDPTPWVNLDETDQITLNQMYAGVADGSSPGNSAPQLIRFVAKANRNEYVYTARNGWWNMIPHTVVNDTQTYLKTHKASPPSDSLTMVSQKDGTIETKSAWRPLNQAEVKSGRFHTQQVRFYEAIPTSGSPCFRDATWGLVALHIIQKTPSAPYFVYATFEQADNLLTADGKPVEDVDGNLMQPAPATPTTPQVCLVDPQPKPGLPPPSVILTSDPTTCQPVQKAAYCVTPGKRLYYVNENTGFAVPPPAPVGGNICVNKRDNDLPSYVVDANKAAHSAISAYLQTNQIKSAPWLYYKLINVQYYPYNKDISKVKITPNGSLYTSKPPYTAKNPAPSSFYQANIVVETNRSLQLFSGGLTIPPGLGVSTDWNGDGSPHVNTYYAGNGYNTGGCMGCHGSQGQNPANQAGDFSVILARGAVAFPEYPAQLTANGMSVVPRNRSIK